MSQVWLSASIKEKMISEAEELAPLETGGILVGYESHHDLVVVDVIGPGPGAYHSVTSFIPDHEYQRLEVARLFYASPTRHHYLGDWHSHPTGSKFLSAKDRSTLRRIGRARAAQVKEPVMMILVGPHWKPVAWGWERSCKGVFGRRQFAVELGITMY